MVKTVTKTQIKIFKKRIELFVRTVTKKNEKSNESTLMQSQQPKIDNVSTNISNGTLLVEQSFLAKTYLILKILSRRLDREIYIISKSPPDQYSVLKSKMEK